MRKLIIGSLGVILLVSCSPRITTKIINQQRALGEGQKVTVYNYKEQLPGNYKILGTVDAGDTGFTVDCDSSKMMTLIVNESRKMGGNAFLITEHKRPSLGGSSCHRIKGLILSVADVWQEEENNSGLGEIALSLKKQRLLPRFNFSAGLGPSWRTDKIASGLDDFQYNFYKELRSGFQWNISADYFFNDIYGVRFTYQLFLINSKINASKCFAKYL